MQTRRIYSALRCLVQPSALRTEPPAKLASVFSKPVTLIGSHLSLAKALDSIRRQSGTTIISDLGDVSPLAQIRLNRVGFWQAADTIARTVKGRISVSSRDGSVRLVRPEPGDRDAPVSYQGPFRVRVVRVSSTRDLTSDQAQCVCSLELNWTPNLRPLFVEEKMRQLQVRDVREQLVEARQEASGLIAVDGRFSYSADLTLAAFPGLTGPSKPCRASFW